MTYVLADNQIMNAASFEEAGLMLNAGDIRNNHQLLAHIFEHLEALIQDRPLRQHMAERMQAMVEDRKSTRLNSSH